MARNGVLWRSERIWSAGPAERTIYGGEITMAVDVTGSSSELELLVRPQLGRRLAWTAAILFYGLGDLLSTIAGLRLGAEEANPLPAALIEIAPGFPETAALLAAWKFLTIVGFVLLASLVSRPYDLAVPVGLALIGTVVVGWNGFVLATLAS